MKTLKTLFFALLILAITPMATAQTADEILANFFENTGGLENWKNINALKYTGSIDLGGMELPIEMIQTASGKSLMKGDFQGQTFYQNEYMVRIFHVRLPHRFLHIDLMFLVIEKVP